MTVTQEPAPPAAAPPAAAPPAAAPPAAAPPAERLRWGTLLVVLAGVFMTTLDFFIVNVAIPSVQRELRAGAGAIEWTVAGFNLAVASGVIMAGRLGDRYGRRRVYGIGLALFTLASLECGLAPGAGWLVAARVAQGVAAALMTPQALAILGTAFTGRARARAFSAYGMSMGLAAVFGQLIGGALIRADLFGLGWRSCFLINVPVGVLALAALRRAVPPSAGTGRARLDLAGAALVTGALVATVLPLISGQSEGWPLWTVLSLGLAALLSVAFVGYQRRLDRRGGEPLIGPDLFRDRAFTAGLVAQLAFWMGQGSFFLVLALYLQQGHRLDALRSGIVFAAIGAGYLVTSTLSHRIAARLGRQAVAVGTLVMALGLALMYLTVGRIGVTGPVAALAPALAVDGAGMGMALAPLVSIVLARVRPRHAGAASGVLSTAMQVGGALGVAVVGLVFHRSLGAGADHARAFRAAIEVLVAVALAVAALVQLLPSRSGRPGPSGRIAS
jgi:EmrB/QacA subfamily drug resistance transporter